MDIAQLDALIRIGTVTTLLLLAGLLLRHRAGMGLPAILFAGLATSLSCIVIGNTPESLMRLTGSVGNVAHILGGYAVVFLWWFCLSCFDPKFRPEGTVLTVGLLWAVIASADRGLFGGRLAALDLSRLLVPMGLGIVAHLIWRLLAERSGDFIAQRQDARVMISMLLGGLLAIDLACDLIFGFDWKPLAFTMAQNAAILGFAVWLLGKLVVVRGDVLSFGVKPVVAPARVSQDPLFQRVREQIEVQRAFLDADLDFATFAKMTATPQKTLRAFIHEELGFDHFRSIVNHYRVAEARRLLGDPHRADDKIIAIALDSGFASLASFNRVFRAAENCSPTEFRAAALGAGVSANPVADSF